MQKAANGDFLLVIKIGESRKLGRASKKVLVKLFQKLVGLGKAQGKKKKKKHSKRSDAVRREYADFGRFLGRIWNPLNELGMRNEE